MYRENQEEVLQLKRTPITNSEDEIEEVTANQNRVVTEAVIHPSTSSPIAMERYTSDDEEGNGTELLEMPGILNTQQQWDQIAERVEKEAEEDKKKKKDKKKVTFNTIKTVKRISPSKAPKKLQNPKKLKRVETISEVQQLAQ